MGVDLVVFVSIMVFDDVYVVLCVIFLLGLVVVLISDDYGMVFFVVCGGYFVVDLFFGYIV